MHGFRTNISFFACSGTFYFGAVNNDWTTPQNDALWRDAVKTLFDPCPAGWRVPLSGSVASGLNPWGLFTSDNSIWTANDGRFWDSSVINGGAAWYPTANERHRNNGSMNYENYGSVYSSTVNGTYCLYFFYTDTNVSVYGYGSGGYHRGYGHSVRCIRE